MAIIDQPFDQRGIQLLNTSLQTPGRAPGHGCLITHTNGRIYCIFAQNYLTAVRQRLLYISYTVDNGLNWTTPVQLTPSGWCDDPSGIQMDPFDVNSDIGLVYTHIDNVETITDTLIHRITIDANTLAATSAFDALSGPSTSYKYPSLVSIPGGFRVYAIASQFSGSADLFYWDNTIGFTTNNWTSGNISIFLGSLTLTMFSANVRVLQNGDFMVLATARTALDGAATGGYGNLGGGIFRSDVYVVTSSDQGTTWNTPQKLTSYAGTPALDMTGIRSAFDADFGQTSDGKISVVFQEGTSVQFISSATTATLPSNAGTVVASVYHATHNLLIVGTDHVTNGGVWIFNLTTGIRTRLYTGSTPALWGNVIRDLALSSDDKYLAVSHSTGLDILDTTSGTVTSWSLTAVRSTTTPPSRTSNMGQCEFDLSGYGLFVGYQSNTVTDVWGFRVDASNVSGGIVDLSLSLGGSFAGLPFCVTPTGLVVVTPGSPAIARVNKTTGADDYHTLISGAGWSQLAYDDVNDEIILSGTANSIAGLHRVSYTNPFTVVGSFGAGTTPSVPSSLESSICTLPGSGVWFEAGITGAVNQEFYSFSEQSPMGYAAYARQGQSLGDATYNLTLGSQNHAKNGTWRLSSESATVLLLPITESGRIRYAVYDYNTGTGQLDTTGVDFYDMVNLAKVGSQGLVLNKPKCVVAPDDSLISYFKKIDYYSSTQVFAPVTGVVEPDAYKLQIRARILGHPTRAFTSRARIRVDHTGTLDIRAHIVFAQCIMMKARIVPYSNQTMDIRAAIFGEKNLSILNTFEVNSAQSQVLAMQFYTTLSPTRKSMSVGARIVAVQSTQFLNTFSPHRMFNPEGTISIHINASMLQTMQIRGKITRL